MAITTILNTDSGASSLTQINANFVDLDTTKADLASPTFTGTPIAPTASTGTSTTQVATTAFVATAVTNTSTSGVSAGPASSSTQTITHGLGRTPTIIRLHSLGTNSSTNGTPGFSHGVYDASGNRCIYLEAQAGMETVVSDTTNAIHISYYIGGGNDADGIVQNITATTFDIVWTATGSITTNAYFLWEAQ